MMRVCVAIILSAAIGTSADQSLKIYQSPSTVRSHFPQAGLIGDRIHIRSDPPVPAHGLPKSRKLFSRSKLSFSDHLAPKYVIHSDLKKESYEEGAHKNEKNNNKPVEIKPILKSIGYRNAKTIKTHYQAPTLEISTKTNFRTTADGPQVYKNMNKKHHDSNFGREVKTKYTETKYADLSSSKITEYGNPKEAYGNLQMESMKQDRSLPYAPSKSLATAGDDIQSDRFTKEEQHEYFSDSSATPTIQTAYTYDPHRDLSTVYGTPKSNVEPKSLENMYDAMYAEDLTYGVPRSMDDTYALSKDMTPRNGIPRKHDNHHSSHFEFNALKINDNAGHPKKSHYSSIYHENHKLDNRYSSQSTNSNDANVFLGDTFEEHAFIASKHTAKHNDRNFEHSRLDYVEDRDQNYDIQNFEQNNFKEYDQTYNARNHQESSSVQSSYEHGAERELSHLPQEFVSTQNSPGITGVTQAIVRKNTPAPAQHTPQNKFDYVSGDIPLHTHVNNEGLRSNPSVNTNLPHTRNLYGGSSKKVISRVVKQGFKGANSHNHEEDSFEGYTFGRNADNHENISPVYRFEYAVSDHGSESQFGHRESRQHQRAKGSYHVLLPDGRKQIVEYEADERGFNPTITYEEAEPSNEHYSRSNYKNGYNENSQNYNRNNKFLDKSESADHYKNYGSDQNRNSQRIQESVRNEELDDSDFRDHYVHEPNVRDYDSGYASDASTNRKHTDAIDNKFDSRRIF